MVIAEYAARARAGRRIARAYRAGIVLLECGRVSRLSLVTAITIAVIASVFASAVVVVGVAGFVGFVGGLLEPFVLAVDG